MGLRLRVDMRSTRPMVQLEILSSSFVPDLFRLFLGVSPKMGVADVLSIVGVAVGALRVSRFVPSFEPA